MRKWRWEINTSNEKVLEVCKPKISKIYQNKMKFTINFQNYLTPFFHKYSATLKNVIKPPVQAEISKFDQKMSTKLEKKEPNKTQSENFQDFFNKPVKENPQSSNPFDMIDEANTQKVLLSQPQMSNLPKEDFDFSDIGNPNSNSKFKKMNEKRFEKGMGQKKHEEEGKRE